jgi:O-antigen/teichoic acid export membrane protein
MSCIQCYSQFSSELRILSVVYLTGYGYAYIRLLLQSKDRIELLTFVLFIYAILNVVIGLILLFLMHIKGLLLGMFISHIAIAIIVYFHGEKIFVGKFSWMLLRKVLRVGFPMMALSLSFYLMYRIDNIIIFVLLGRESAGYYGLATFIAIVINYFPTSISTVLFPKMMLDFSVSLKREDISHYLDRPLLVLSRIMPLLLGILYINIDVPLMTILQKYLPALSALKILIISLFFASLITMPTNILIAFKKHKKLMYGVLAVVGLGTFTDYAVIRLGLGIEGVAYATGGVFIVISTMTIFYALHSFHKEIKEILRYIFTLYIPLCYSIGLLSLVSIISINVVNMWMKCLLQSLLYIIIYVPMLIILLRNRKIFTS